MISFEEAYDVMMAAARNLPAGTVALGAAAGRVLAADVRSDVDMPPFDKAAMDGYACRRADLAAGAVLEIIEEIPAGSWPRETVRPGTCARIFTGAPMPAGADCVLMQEQAERQAARVRVIDPATRSNVCRRAEDVQAGAVVLRRGERISPAHVAVLAAAGVTDVAVAGLPRVAVLSTGNELVEPACRPGPARIRNSNAWQLMAQLATMGITPSYHGIVPDREEPLTAAIGAAAATADVLLVSGGVSAGDYDLAPDVLRKLGFTFAFASVAMQPGRPTIFARKGDVYCCGLPGNPVSTYIVFEILVKPFLYRLMGCTWRPLTVEARLAEPVRRKNPSRRAAVLVRFVAPGTVAPVAYHGSAHVGAAAAADGIMFIPTGTAGYEEGETVLVGSLPA